MPPRREASESSASDEEEPAPATFPTKLIGRVLQESFESKSTRISPDALTVITEYLRIYTREAIWRASQEKSKSGTVAATGYLEVEDLEKITGPLTLDFS